MSNSTTLLDTLASGQAQNIVTANALFDAASQALLGGRRIIKKSGLTWGFYGGIFKISGVPTAVANGTVALSASTTNYIYISAAGVVTKTTTQPTGWPGPIISPEGALALYQIVTGTDTVTSYTDYRTAALSDGTLTSISLPERSANLRTTRARSWQVTGGSSTNSTAHGWDITSTASLVARTLGSTFLAEGIPYAVIATGTSAGTGVEFYSTRNFCFLGNAAGRGGFDVSFRWCYETGAAPANQRSFIGLRDITAGVIGNVEPSSLTNIIGVGADAGEANLSIMHNDGSGTATKVSLGSSFPARATANVYEFRLYADANASTVSYVITCENDGSLATGSLSSNLPANTQFLGCSQWINNGSSASSGTLGLMQMIAETRY